MCLHDNTSKKPIEGLSRKIWLQMSRGPSGGHLKWWPAEKSRCQLTTVKLTLLRSAFKWLKQD